jgi:hypothetical protein
MATWRHWTASVLACLFLAVAIPVAASDVDAPAGDSTAPRRVLSTNPFLVMFGWYNAEFEFMVNQTASVGITGSYLTFGDVIDQDEETFKSVSGVYRYYPQGHALRGFFFGGRLAYYSVTAQITSGANAGDEESGTFFGAGFDLGFRWLLGAEEKFEVSLGIGAVRLFGGDLEDVSLTLPSIRLVNVGAAF